MRHGGEKAESNFVVNFQTDNAGVIEARNDQLNISYKGILRPVKWFDMTYGINMLIGKSKSHYDMNAQSVGNVPSYYSLFDADGSRSQYALSGFNIYSKYNEEFETTSMLKPLGYNHLDELENNFNNTTKRNTRYFLHLNLKPFDGLSIKPQFQYEDNVSDTRVHSEEDSYMMRWLQNVYTTRSGAGTAEDPYSYENLIPQGGRLYTSENKMQSYTFRTQIDYEKEFGRHFISIIGGTEFRQTKSLGVSGGLFGYDDQLQVQSTSSMDFYELSNVVNTFWNASVWPSYMEYPFYVDVFNLSTETKHRYASAYANFTYTFDEKYNVFGSARKDYADLFGGAPKFRGRPLWSAGVAWNISKERFMENVTAINFLKLRASYGVTGNIASNYTSRLTASITGTQRYTNLPTATIKTPPNDKLRWERTATTNIGFDVNMLDYRLRASVDWYRKEGTDLLAQKRLDVTQGYTTLVINNGDMLNKGVELSVGYVWIKPENQDGFRWSTNLNYSHNKNEITKVDDLVSTPSELAGSGSFVEGKPVNSLFSYQYKGLTENGIPQFLLSDGTLTTGRIPSSDIDAVVYSGSSDPATTFSVNNSIEYKGLSLTVFGVYYGGHYFRDNVAGSYHTPSYGPMPDYLLNSWTPDKTNTLIPGSGQYYQPEQQATGTQVRLADTWVKKANFFKVRNIVLGYELPKQISEKIKAQSMQLRFQVNNPGIEWTKDNTHDDPETGGASIPTSYILGLNIKF